MLHRLEGEMQEFGWFQDSIRDWPRLRAELLVLRDAMRARGSPEPRDGADAGDALRVSPRPRVLLSATTEQIHEFLYEQFQEGGRPTYDDAQGEGWGRTTYASHLAILETHGLIQRERGRIVTVYPRHMARPASAEDSPRLNRD
ncbi:MAG: hypothetical protein AB7U23_11350 [Dehalococcoidia bacterium]